ncbi:TIGR02466 family protein [Lacibacterium aquatile]|uniref:TIGR02466 family protein n=1 Tax=Lacibacterium aquatile TaxID=1168082 RepID=A0ABW5DMN8_9PROT
MEIRNLFATPLIVSQLAPDTPLVADLKQAILRRADTVPSVSHSNDGGWQSAGDFLDWSGEAGAALIDAVRQMIDQVTVVWEGGALTSDALDWHIGAWANINRRGNGNAPHVHPGAYWSGCFYVDDGGIDGRDDQGGALEFSDPRGPLPLMAAPTVKVGLPGFLTAGLGERLYPKMGMLVLFPSWLQHAVTAYHGDGTRISVAFNFSLKLG